MNQIKAGIILNYFVIFLNTIVGLLYTPYMLRMMGQSEYGIYSLVASVISYLTILDLGLGNAIIRYTSQYIAEGKKQEQYELFGMFIVLYIVISVIAVIGGIAILVNVDNLFGETMTPLEIERSRTMLIILVFNLGFTFPMSLFTSIVAAYERFVFPRLVNIIRILLNTLLMILLLHLGFKAVAMVVLHTIFNVSTLLINYVYCKKKLHIKIKFGRFNFSFLKEVAIYSFWIFLNVIMDKIYWSTGQFVLGAIVSTTAIAVFAVAIQLMYMYMQLSTAVSGVFLPKVTSMITLKTSNHVISDLFIKVGRLQNVVMSLILFGFCVFGRSFVKLWAGDDYEGAYCISLLFFVSLYIPLIQNLGITILQARNQMRFRSLLYITIAIISLFLQVLFTQKWGEYGCAIAIAGSLFIGQGLIMNIYYQTVQKIDIRLFWVTIIKMNLLPILLTILFYFILDRGNRIDTWGQLICWGLLYFFVYVLVTYGFSLNGEERGMFQTYIKKYLHVK